MRDAIWRDGGQECPNGGHGLGSDKQTRSQYDDKNGSVGLCEIRRHMSDLGIEVITSNW